MVENIKKLLDEGRTVICDRYYYSSVAYQGYGREQNVNEIIELNKWATDGVEPDLIIFMNTTPETAALRKQFEKLDRIESESRDFHERVYDGYHMIFKDMDNVYIIDEEDRYPEVYKEINNQMNLLFKGE
jgi:dTMP kinase